MTPGGRTGRPWDAAVDEHIGVVCDCPELGDPVGPESTFRLPGLDRDLGNPGLHAPPGRRAHLAGAVERAHVVSCLVDGDSST